MTPAPEHCATGAPAAPSGAPAVAPVSVRPPRAEEVPAVLALVEAGVREGRLLPRDPVEVLRHRHHWLVAHRDGAVLGCLSLEPTAPGLSEVRSVCVAPAVRHFGVGAALVDAVLARAAARGGGRLFAVTAAHALFRKAGFRALPVGAAAWQYVLRPIRPTYWVLYRDVVAADGLPASRPRAARFARGAAASPEEVLHGQRVALA